MEAQVLCGWVLVLAPEEAPSCCDGSYSFLQ